MSRALDIHLRGRDQNASRVLRGVDSAASSLGSGLMNLRNIFVAVLGGAILRRGLNVMSGLVSEFANAEQSQRLLARAIEINGAAVDAWMPKLLTFADTIERTTTVSADSATEMMKMASGMGVGADQLERVTQAAIGLSEALGISTEMALVAVNREIVEGKSSLDRYLPALREAATHQERLAIVTESANRGFELAQDRVNTTSGAMAQMQNTMGRVREAIGEAFAPAAKRFAQLFNDLVGGALDRVKDQLWLVGEGMRRAADVMIGVGATMARGVVSAFTAAEVAITRWRDVADLAWTSFKLGALVLWNDTKFLFGTQIPQLLDWFGNNWKKWFADLANIAITVFKNLSSNVVNVFTMLPELIAGTADWSQVWTPLTEGFIATIDALPTLAEREFTELEHKLGKRVNSLRNSLLNDFAIKLNDRLIRLGLAGGPAGAGGDGAGGDEEGKGLPEIELKLNPDAKAALEDGMSIDRARRGGGTTPELQAREFRFLTRAPGVDQQIQHARATADNTTRIVKSTQEVAGLVKQGNTLLARIANTPPGIVEGGGLA